MSRVAQDTLVLQGTVLDIFPVHVTLTFDLLYGVTQKCNCCFGMFVPHQHPRVAPAFIRTFWDPCP